MNAAAVAVCADSGWKQLASGFLWKRGMPEGSGSAFTDTLAVFFPLCACFVSGLSGEE